MHINSAINIANFLQDDRRWKTTDIQWKVVKIMAVTRPTAGPLIP
jgi:hypothetical protein